MLDTKIKRDHFGEQRSNRIRCVLRRLVVVFQRAEGIGGLAW